MKHFSKICGVLAIVSLSLFPSQAYAQFFNHLSGGVGVGTTGITVELSSPVFSPLINARAGVDIMPNISFNTDADFEFDNNYNYYGNVDLEGSLGRVQGHLLFDINPIPGWRGFHVTAGAYFAGNKLLKIKGYSQELADYSQQTGTLGNVIIGDYSIPTDGRGNVDGGLKVNGFRPYLGIGFGRSVPGKFMSVAFDMGVQFEGKPEIYTKFGEVDKTQFDDDNTINKIRDALSVYPVLSLRLYFRAF